jgi:hypothetical protein
MLTTVSQLYRLELETDREFWTDKDVKDSGRDQFQAVCAVLENHEKFQDSPIASENLISRHTPAIVVSHHGKYFGQNRLGNMRFILYKLTILHWRPALFSEELNLNLDCFY